eukprot:SAG31_NODE_6711_length_1916_cov_1.727573_1_plen_126_part_00
MSASFLPPGWEARVDPGTDETYYVGMPFMLPSHSMFTGLFFNVLCFCALLDHSTKTTTWDPPALGPKWISTRGSGAETTWAPYQQGVGAALEFAFKACRPRSQVPIDSERYVVLEVRTIRIYQDA